MHLSISVSVSGLSTAQRPHRADLKVENPDSSVGHAYYTHTCIPSAHAHPRDRKGTHLNESPSTKRDKRLPLTLPPQNRRRRHRLLSSLEYLSRPGQTNLLSTPLPVRRKINSAPSYILQIGMYVCRYVLLDANVRRQCVFGHGMHEHEHEHDEHEYEHDEHEHERGGASGKRNETIRDRTERDRTGVETERDKMISDN
ncbi:hypothetical protein BZA05DRAFT_384579 [Tricharina praecox]|uniref:uncharacterized protein n=1 Tax=Tricharina praecox TaxID=43433 RepID=UPI00221FF669|nr:uncharacterized protein BZA05DRAFT_384579 [Tricharina praecox]KAI5857710.1 hypothetical protein BZA05DRAFT_384579 [Tricharina praecox]